MKTIMMFAVSIFATLIISSCMGHKVDANNVTDTGATSPGISTDSGTKKHDSTKLSTDNGNVKKTADSLRNPVK